MELNKVTEVCKKEFLFTNSTAAFRVTQHNGVLSFANKTVAQSKFRKCFEMDMQEFFKFTELLILELAK